MTPATKTDNSNKSTSRPGPTNAPSAPASFQSPAPRLRTRTNGSRRPNPTTAPSSELFNPPQPPSTVFPTTPTTNAGTVSQFGMRRLRRSDQPAIRANRQPQPG